MDKPPRPALFARLKQVAPIAITVISTAISIASVYYARVFKYYKLSASVIASDVEIIMRSDKPNVSINASVTLANAGNQPFVIQGMYTLMWVMPSLPKGIDECEDASKTATEFIIFNNDPGEFEPYVVKEGSIDTRRVVLHSTPVMDGRLNKLRDSRKPINMCVFIGFQGFAPGWGMFDQHLLWAMLDRNPDGSRILSPNHEVYAGVDLTELLNYWSFF